MGQAVEDLFSMLEAVNGHPSVVDGELLTNIPAMVTVPVQKATNARMIIAMTKKRDANATVGTKRPAEIIWDRLLVQEKGRLCRPSSAAREGRKAKFHRAWESVLVGFVRFVRLSLMDGTSAGSVACTWLSPRDSSDSWKSLEDETSGCSSCLASEVALMDWDREKLLRMLRIDSKMAMADNVQASEGCELLRYKSGVLELYARPKKVPRACSPRRSIRARYARLERAICKDATGYVSVWSLDGGKLLADGKSSYPSQHHEPNMDI
jgi:hypothetical protein